MAGMALGSTAFLKAALGTTEIQKISLGTTDIWTSFTPVTWSDDFNRANASTLGTGWTQGGTGSGIGITTNATDWNGSTDGLAWAIRDTSANGDDQFVEAVVKLPNSTRDSRLLLHANSTLTNFATLNWFTGSLYIARSNGSYTSTVDLASLTTGVSLSTGDTLRFWNVGNVFKASINGVEKLSFTDSGNTILRNSTTRRVGFGQKRSSFGNSGNLDNWTGGDL